MSKDIIKIVLSGIIAYPLMLLCIRLEGSYSEITWIVAFVIDIIVCICLIRETIKDRKL